MLLKHWAFACHWPLILVDSLRGCFFFSTSNRCFLMLADSLRVCLAILFPFNLGQFLPILLPVSPVLVTYDLRVFFAVPSFLLPKISGCFSRYLFLCSRCFRFISINYMRGSFFTLSSSTSVLSSYVLSSFTASFKVPSSWTFKNWPDRLNLLFSSLLSS